MTTLKKLTEQNRAPAHTLVLDPWVFADSWSSKPREAVCIGLRALAESDYTNARIESAKFCRQKHPEGGTDQLDCFNDALMRWLVSYAVCDPNNVQKPAKVFGLTDDELIGLALTARGVRFIFDAILKFNVESSPLYPEIDANGIQDLKTILDNAILTRTGSIASTARRHLQFALDGLRLAAL